MEATTPLLSLKSITKRYPGVIALDRVSVEFHKGEVHALLGENGAGKSTLIKTITGALNPDEGEIIFEGKSYTSLNTALSRDLGISAVYQESNLVHQISVTDNIFLGSYARKGVFVDDDTMCTKASELLATLGMNVDPRTQALLLSAAQKQIIEIARALARNLKLIIFDEPTSALMVSEVDQLFEIIKQLKEKGIAVIYITHRIEELFRIADRVTIMRDGKYIDTVEPALTSRYQMINMMVGRELTENYPHTTREVSEKPILEVKNISGEGFRNVSFTVQAGEIVGFAGLIGAGRTETALAIFGARKLTEGEIYLHGKKLHNTSPGQAIQNGIGYIPEERKEQGLFLLDNIRHNVSIASIKKHTKFGFVNTKTENETADAYCQKMRVKAPHFGEIVMNLSGGNQQKVLVAKWLATQCQVLFFDEPTRGIDVGARQEIYELMTAMVDEGIAVVLISSDMGEIIGMADRVIVFYEGEVMGQLNREQLTQSAIMEIASGQRQYERENTMV